MTGWSKIEEDKLINLQSTSKPPLVSIPDNKLVVVMVQRWFVDPRLVLIKHEKYVIWDGRKYCVDLKNDDEDRNPDPKKQ